MCHLMFTEHKVQTALKVQFTEQIPSLSVVSGVDL